MLFVLPHYFDSLLPFQRDFYWVKEEDISAVEVHEEFLESLKILPFLTISCMAILFIQHAVSSDGNMLYSLKFMTEIDICLVGILDEAK